MSFKVRVTGVALLVAFAVLPAAMAWAAANTMPVDPGPKLKNLTSKYWEL